VVRLCGPGCGRAEALTGQGEDCAWSARRGPSAAAATRAPLAQSPTAAARGTLPGAAAPIQREPRAVRPHRWAAGTPKTAPRDATTSGARRGKPDDRSPDYPAGRRGRRHPRGLPPRRGSRPASATRGSSSHGHPIGGLPSSPCAAVVNEVTRAPSPTPRIGPGQSASPRRRHAGGQHAPCSAPQADAVQGRRQQRTPSMVLHRRMTALAQNHERAQQVTSTARAR